MATIVVAEYEFTIVATGTVRLPFPIDVSRGVEASIEVYVVDGGWTATPGKLVVQQSNSGLNFEALATPVEFTADGIKVADVSDVRYMDIRETVALTAGSVVSIRVVVSDET